MNQDIRSIEDLPDADELNLGDAAPLIERIIEGAISKVLPGATAASVYGEPVTQGHRTVIPVAQVSHRYGFGAGAGSGIASEDSDGGMDVAGEPVRKGGGGGGGGGGQLNVRPVGIIEITPEGTIFEPIVDRNTLLTTIMPFIGFALILAIWRLTRR